PAPATVPVAQTFRPPPPVAQEPDPAPAAPKPAEPAGMVEPPPGKTACKFHPNSAGHWLCQKCVELYCTVCVATKRTSAGTNYFCRQCGTQVLPARIRFVPKKEKQAKVYSDAQLLGRSLGFGFAAMLVGIGIWTGLAALMQFDVPFLFAPAIG